jgi:phosphomannomutase
MKQIVLYDMDGTLTPPREPLEESLVPVLEQLSEVADIGIVTGSDYDYLKQQVGLLLDHSKIRKKLHLLPCNGTKHYYPPSNNYEEHKLVSKRNMIDELGRRHFQQLMLILIEQQANFSNERFPLTGHFINYRGSMINWCPIGRNAEAEDRQFFVDYDNSFTPTIREKYLDRLRHYTGLKRILNIQIKLGGDTSFDIFPTGWDKTYCLQHFPDHVHWFVGDRCGKNGNDKEIYDLLKPKKRSFSVEGPDETRIITGLILNEIQAT